MYKILQRMSNKNILQFALINIFCDVCLENVVQRITETCSASNLLASTLVISNVLERRIIAPCPTGSKPMFRPDGQPRKCLPHQNSLCVNALPDQPDATTVCCWHNQVDYFCCLDVTPLDCPDYHNVTVVVHNAYPQNPFAL
ncbi:hypothetical protein WUBG_14517, partial [Wuchereria bancrofti]